MDLELSRGTTVLYVHRHDLAAKEKAQKENEEEYISLKQADKFFKDLHELDRKLGSYTMKVLIGDGNLRLHARQRGEEAILGPGISHSPSPRQGQEESRFQPRKVDDLRQ